MNDETREIIKTLETVLTMRDLQKVFFKSRLMGDLKRSKQLEAVVDREVARILAKLKGNPIVNQERLL